jgi:hypothetical protein
MPLLLSSAARDPISIQREFQQLAATARKDPSLRGTARQMLAGTQQAAIARLANMLTARGLEAGEWWELVRSLQPVP